MADFTISLERTLKFEGVYSIDPVDRGAETVYGISRKHHPEWEGWALIDQLKNKPASSLKNAIICEPLVQQIVTTFYRENYWDGIRGEELTNQALADTLFDCAVNMGVKRAIQFLQAALNVLNRNGELYPDMPEDGVFGWQTKSAIGRLGSLRFLAGAVVIEMGAFYLRILKEHPEQERFARGWFSRVGASGEKES